MRKYEKFREWTASEVEFLKANCELSHGEIAEELPQRSEASVRYARRKYGCDFSGKRSYVSKIGQLARGEAIRDARGPDVEHLYGAGSPCLRCWNRDGSKSRFGCLKCSERMKFDEETSARGVLLSFDNCDYRHQLSYNRSPSKFRNR